MLDAALYPGLPQLASLATLLQVGEGEELCTSSSMCLIRTVYYSVPVPIHIDMCHVNDDINFVEHVFTACMHHNVHRAWVHVSMFTDKLGSRMSTEINVLISNILYVGKVVNTCSTNVPLHLHIVGQGLVKGHSLLLCIHIP